MVSLSRVKFFAIPSVVDLGTAGTNAQAETRVSIKLMYYYKPVHQSMIFFGKHVMTKVGSFCFDIDHG